MRGMQCTVCYQDTGCEPFSTADNLSLEAVVALATSWRCDECLAEAEREMAAATPEADAQ